MKALATQLLALHLIFVLLGCRRSIPSETTEATPAGQSDSNSYSPLPPIESSGSASIENPRGSSKPKRSIDHRVVELAGIVKDARARKERYQGFYSMQDLMSKWDPLGAEKGTLIQLLGYPTYERNDELEYVLDTGSYGAIWKFRMENDVVVSVAKTYLE